MRRRHRAIREARQVLISAGVRKAPVDVYKLARAYAVVNEKEMPDSISGMLVPVAGGSSKKHHVIVVNSKHADVRKRFTVAHELGHLLLHDYRAPHADTGFKIRFRANREYEGSISEEIEANQFAAEILMPAAIILERIQGLDIEYVSSDEENSDLDALAREFKVSKQALQIRLSAFI